MEPIRAVIEVFLAVVMYVAIFNFLVTVPRILAEKKDLIREQNLILTDIERKIGYYD